MNEKTRKWWKVTKQDVGRELANPDYVDELEAELADVLQEIAFTREHWIDPQAYNEDLQRWQAQVEALREMADYGEMEMRKKYKDEGKLEKLLSAINRLPSNHRTFDAYKRETLDALLEKGAEDGGSV